MIKLLITLCFMYDLSTRLFNFVHQTMKYISTSKLDVIIDHHIHHLANEHKI